MGEVAIVRVFCTYFDARYLTRGIALWHSLSRTLGGAHLYVLCFDGAAHAALTALAFPGVTPIALTELEAGDDRLLEAKKHRSPVEYYFTTSPSLPLYVLRREPAAESVTYLDADLYFFDSLDPLFDELGSGAVGIIEHRFPPHLASLLQYGRFNVGCAIFRNDPRGRAVLEWWRERCLEWCYDTPEPGRFADQKYLDVWPGSFDGVAVLQHRGANLAPWNVGGARLDLRDGRLLVDGEPLLFYHFHNLRLWGRSLWQLGLAAYRVRPSRLLRDEIYRPYIGALHAAERELDARGLAAAAGHARRTLRHIAGDFVHAPSYFLTGELLIERRGEGAS